MPHPEVKHIAKIDWVSVRNHFPVLDSKVNGFPLVYLDNGASSQMPEPVFNRIHRYHAGEHANVHRGIHTLSQKATDAYEEVRKKTAVFLHAADEHQIVFTTGTTDSINLVANSFGGSILNPGDEILISQMEHHANIVPWQMIAEKTGAVVRAIGVTATGELDLEDFENKLSNKTKIVAIVHISNVLGTINPVETIIKKAHNVGAYVLIDGAQAVLHSAVDVQKLDADFYSFSAHKMCGPTGFGILYGKMDLLEKMPPYRGGGDMIDHVTIEKTTYNRVPFKFEAGTPPISACIGFGAAIDYLTHIGISSISEREKELLEYATSALSGIEDVKIIGTAAKKASVISFNVDGVHPSDIGTILDQRGIAVRTGHHCAQPLMQWFGIPGTVRASLAFYNTETDIDRFVEALKYAITFFKS